MIMKKLGLVLVAVFLTANCGSIPKEGEGQEENQDELTTADVLESFYNLLEYSVDEEVASEETEVISEETGEAREEAGEEEKKSRYEVILSLLSEDASAVFTSVKEKIKDYDSQIEAVCEKKSDLRQELKEQLDAIRDNEELSREEKEEAAQALFAEYKEALSLKRDEYKTCVTDNKDQLFPIYSLKKEMVKACLVRPTHHKIGMRPGFGKGKGPGKKPLNHHNKPAITDTKLEALETALLSEECAATL